MVAKLQDVNCSLRKVGLKAALSLSLSLIHFTLLCVVVGLFTAGVFQLHVMLSWDFLRFNELLTYLVLSVHPRDNRSSRK